MPFFDPSKWEYFRCIHIRKFVFVAAVLAAIVQLYLSIYFLSLHDWWAFISFSVSVVSYCMFIISIRKQSWIMLVIFFAYQVAITLLTLASAIWMLTILIKPKKSWLMRRKCRTYYTNGSTYYYCDHSIATEAGTYFGVFMLFFIVNLLCLHVFYYYWKFVRMESRRNGRPARAAESGPSARPYYPPQPAQTGRGQSVPMETVTVSTPIRPPTVTPAIPTPNNPYSPGNQFPSQPIQQPIQQTTQNYQYPPTAMLPPPAPRSYFPTEADWNSPAPVVVPTARSDAYTVSPTAPQVHSGYGAEGYPTVRGMPTAYNPNRDGPAANLPYSGGGIPQQSFTDGYPTVRGMPTTSPTSHLYDAPPPPYGDPKY